MLKPMSEPVRNTAYDLTENEVGSAKLLGNLLGQCSDALLAIERFDKGQSTMDEKTLQIASALEGTADLCRQIAEAAKKPARAEKTADGFIAKLREVQQSLVAPTKAKATKIFADLMLETEKAVREGCPYVIALMHFSMYCEEYDGKLLRRLVHEFLQDAGFESISYKACKGGGLHVYYALPGFSTTLEAERKNTEPYEFVE
jgi:hypothetical protein